VFQQIIKIIGIKVRKKGFQEKFSKFLRTLKKGLEEKKLFGNYFNMVGLIPFLV